MPFIDDIWIDDDACDECALPVCALCGSCPGYCNCYGQQADELKHDSDKENK